MTQYRRTSRNARVAVASAAIVALSLVGYGSAATASAPTPQTLGTEPALDIAGAPEPAPVTNGGGTSKGEDSGKPAAAGQTRKVVVHDCGFGAPTTTRPDVPMKPSKDIRPATTTQTDPSTGAEPAPPVGADGRKHAKAARPGVVELPELREGRNGVEGFVAPAPECAVPEPVAKPPVTKRPTVTVCPDPAPDLPPGNGGGSQAEPNPGGVTEPDDAQSEDQPVGDSSPSCVDPDTPVTSGDPEPAVDLPAVPGDDVAAREAGASDSSK